MLAIGVGFICVATLANSILVIAIIRDLDKLWKRVGGRR